MFIMSGTFIDVCVETGKFCPSSYKILQKFLNLQNYYAIILKEKTSKLDLFTNFKVLFPLMLPGICTDIKILITMINTSYQPSSRSVL